MEDLGARLLLTTRDPAAISGLRLTGFELQYPGHERRRKIAAALAPGHGDLVDELERRLGGLVQNPLLFIMASAWPSAACAPTHGQNCSRRSPLACRLVMKADS